MPKLSLLMFSRDDIDKAIGLINGLYNMVDDIVLIDSSSRANRRKLYARTKGLGKLRVFYVVALGYPDPLFMYGISKCNGPWILKLDMDERLSDGLRENIKGILDSARCSAFAIKRYEEVSHGKRTAFFTWQIRLFRKGRVLFKGLIHEQPSVKGRLQPLDGEGCYIEHVVELRKHGHDSYNEMQKFERFTYRTYNEKVLDYMSKLNIGDRSRHVTMGSRAVYFLLRLYEAATLRGMESEVGTFDYYMLEYVRNLAYQIKARRIGAPVRALRLTSSYIGRMKEWKREVDSAEDFEIAKLITKEGITKFLGLDDERTIERINRRYIRDRQGITLMFKLLKGRYREWNRVVK